MSGEARVVIHVNGKGWSAEGLSGEARVVIHINGRC